MTNEQAILHLDAVKATTDSGQMHRAIDMAIASLNKQIPMKPKADGWPYCGACGLDILGTDHDGNYYQFCPRCGQAIDWRKDE